MTQEAKIIIGIGIVSVGILFGGIFFLSKKDESQKTTTIDKTVLLKNAKHIGKAKDEKAILVEFADFQCPACGAAFPRVKQVREKYKDNLTFVYHHFPLKQHNNARIAAKAAEAAGEQGKFWEMSDLLYENQLEWSESVTPLRVFDEYAKKLTLDLDSFDKAVEGNKFDKLIQDDYSDGVTIGVNSTPTFFLNGQKLILSSYSDLSAEVGKAIQKSSK